MSSAIAVAVAVSGTLVLLGVVVGYRSGRRGESIPLGWWSAVAILSTALIGVVAAPALLCGRHAGMRAMKCGEGRTEGQAQSGA